MTVDYAKFDYQQRQHHERYARYVQQHGLMCQACSGSGKWYESILSYHDLPMMCTWCEGTGKVTRRIRGLWLRLQPRKGRSN